VVKFLGIIYWITLGLAVTAFWIGLRSKVQNVEFTLLALLLWGVAYFFNWLEKKYKNQK
jgi:hypothetical protein